MDLSNDIVKSTLPYAVKVDQSINDEYTVSLPEITPDLKHPLMVAGKKLLPQDVSCALINHSHIMLSISDSYSHKSFTVFPAGQTTTDNKLQLTLYYYDNNYELKLLGTGIIGNKLLVTPPFDNKGILLLIGDPEVDKGCPVNEEIKHYSFTLKVKY
jgi:hypothetical protein